jgi:hypothetical protein
MEKKFNLFGILGVVVLVAVSTMGSVNFQRVSRNASSLVASALACLPAPSGSEFRSPHFWSGFLIPPVDVTNSLSNPVLACMPVGSAAASQPYQGIPVTGAIAVFPQYQYRSVNAAASLMASPTQVFKQYEYSPAGALPSPIWLFRQYEYRSFNSGTSLAPHKVVYSGH